MAEHDFRYSLLSPQHTLTECRALSPGHYQVTGNGGSILNWQVHCDSCQRVLDFEFAVDASLGEAARPTAANARLAELGWHSQQQQHLCPACHTENHA